MTEHHDALPCGVELETFVAQVADGEPPADPAHQRGCPYCQAALRDLRSGWRDLEALTREPVPVPPGLTARIMAHVRVLAGHLADSIVIGDARGATRVGHTVVGRVIQRIASTVPGVVFASVRTIAHTPPEPARIGVAIQLVVAFGPDIDALADAIRDAVQRRAPRLTGAAVSRIDVSVEDITDPHGR